MTLNRKMDNDEPCPRKHWIMGDRVVYNCLCSTALWMNRLKSGTYLRKEKWILGYIIHSKEKEPSPLLAQIATALLISNKSWFASDEHPSHILLHAQFWLIAITVLNRIFHCSIIFSTIHEKKTKSPAAEYTILSSCETIFLFII